MSIVLDQGTKPKGLEVKTFGSGLTTVFLGAYQISLADFLVIFEYVMTNTDLEPNDERLAFLERLMWMKEVEGYNPGNKHLEVCRPTTPSAA